MLTGLLADLARTPWWMIALVLNLVAGLLAAFTQIATLDHRRVSVRWGGYAVGVIVCAALGALVLLAYGATVRLEAMAFRAAMAARTPAVSRRIH